jgi:formylmethanofuran dehydrogenase subunit E
LQYANIRVEAKGDNAEEIISYLSDVLLMHGKGDEVVNDQIRTFIKKVIGDENDQVTETCEPGEEEETAQDEVAEEIPEWTVKVDSVKMNCQECGEPITQKQAKTSQMFVSKNLCEKCLRKEAGK